MRLFLAVSLPPEVQSHLDEQLEQFKKEYPYFSWVPKENFHITLQYLGDVESIDTIQPSIERALFEVPSLEMYGQSAGIFINSRITMYISFARQKTLEKIVENVRQAFSISDEKEYVPHLTIARYKVPSKQQYLLIKKKLEHMDIDLELSVKSIALFETIAKGAKTEYQLKAEYQLGK